jgi:hypothetical protein
MEVVMVEKTERKEEIRRYTYKEDVPAAALWYRKRKEILVLNSKQDTVATFL